MNANQLLDRHFLDVRARLLEVAATLDRIERAGDSSGPSDSDDPRLAQLQTAIRILLEADGDRAARVQHLFSLEYDPNWRHKFEI